MSHAHLGALLDETRAFHRRFFVVGERELDAMSLWNAHTYVVDCGRATPYLHFYSPEPSSGKTTGLDLLELTAFKAIQADGLSEAALFRLISSRNPTLLFDEVDAVFGKKNSDSTEGIRQVLNSGYRKGKQVWRCVPPAHEVTPFDVFGAKALAGLHGLPGTLAARAIPIAMQPPLPSDVYEELDAEEVEEEAAALRGYLEAWADASQDVLRSRDLRPAKLPELDARGNEIWRILFRVADHAGGEWPERARVAAVELSGRARSQSGASAGVRLLAHIRDLFPDERMSCSTLVDALNADDQLPYGGWNDGKGITTRELGKKLGPYGIKANSIRIGDHVPNGYKREQFEPVWGRYLAVSDPANRYTATSLYPSQKAADTNRYSDPFVAVSQEGANPHGDSDVADVAVSKSEPGPNGGTSLPDDAEIDRLKAIWDEAQTDERQEEPADRDEWLGWAESVAPDPEEDA